MVNKDARIDGGAGVAPVIANGMCIGCGACAAVSEPAHRVVTTERGLYAAVATGDTSAMADRRAGQVCPFADHAISETELAQERFPSAAFDHHLGPLVATHAAYVLKGEHRRSGSSGGMGTWVLERLLASGLIDAVVHVGENLGATDSTDDRPLFSYGISRSVAELRAGAKSRYYPVTLAEVVPLVRRKPGRYAFTGVPCFVKAIRLLARQDPDFGRSVAFCIGLVCGHLKSRGYAEFLAWQLGLAPDRLGRIDFRHKIEDRAANRYGVRALSRAGFPAVDVAAPMQDLYGHDWGMGLFKPKACDYCDDVVAETADLSVGDAWLPRYVADGAGTNLIIVRNAALEALLQEGARGGEIHLEPLKPEDVVQSQAAGFSHRRAGLAYRLWLADQRGLWRPLKRVQPKAPSGDTAFERKHRLRMQLAQASHEAFLQAKRTGRLEVFFDTIVPLAERYRDQSRAIGKRWLARLKTWLIGDRLAVRAIRRSTRRHK